jgi:hypothetical protein
MTLAEDLTFKEAEKVARDAIDQGHKHVRVVRCPCGSNCGMTLAEDLTWISSPLTRHRPRSLDNKAPYARLPLGATPT